TFEIQDALDAEAVAQADDAGPAGGPFEPEVYQNADSDDAERTPQQRIVAALLLRSLADFRPGVVEHVASVLTYTIMIPLALAMGFFLVIGVYSPLSWANLLFGWGDGGLLYLLPWSLLLLASGFRRLGQYKKIETLWKDGRLAGFKLGRL